MDHNFFISKKVILRASLYAGFFVLAFLAGSIMNASYASSEKGEPIIDLQCQRAKIFSPESEFAETCSVYGNTESEIIDRAKANQAEYKINCVKYDNGTQKCYGENVLGSDWVFTRESLPNMIRIGITLIFAAYAFITIALGLWYLYKWVWASDNDNQVRDAWQGFYNMFRGLIVGLGAFFFSSAIWWAAGYPFNPFEGLQKEFDSLMMTDCASLEKNVCDKYDESCSWNNWQYRISDNPTQQRGLCCQKGQEVSVDGKGIATCASPSE